MAKPSDLNPLKYIIDRQFNEKLFIKNKIFSERLSKAKNLYRKDLFAHYGCVNAIEFSAEGELLVSGGDDRRVLLWSVPEAIYDKGAPVVMRTTHGSNIFCVAFDSCNSKIYSGGNDDQVLIHEIYTKNLVTSIPHRKPVNGLSINPQNDNVIATAGDDGRLLFYDVREPTNQETQVLAKQKTGFHSVMFNPTNPRFVVSANSEEGIALWDSRKPKEELVHYDRENGKISGISASFNSTGQKVLALRRRLPPVLYATQSEESLCQFYHPQYYNSCTMKTCCFAGDNDEYVLSGSDDFNLYMWKLPKDNVDEWGPCHMVLRGHRSIVNQVRYNKHTNLLASSGVEKMIKLWSSVPIGSWRGSLLQEHKDPSRIVYTHEDYVTLVGHTGERITHDYSDQSTLEDAKMMAFFDTLIQREIEGWESDPDSLLPSDSDSDDDQDWLEVIKKMFLNGQTSSDEFNKIAQLIMKKRNRLAKLAYNKSTSSIKRRIHKETLKKQKIAMKRKVTHKVNGIHKKGSKQQTSHNNIDLNRNTSNSESSRCCRYRTRQSLREASYDSSGIEIIDAPSTSTGITNSSSSVYRVIDQDSDDDTPPTNNCDQNGVVEEPENLVNILPTPFNGTHDIFINMLEIASTNGDLVATISEDLTASTSGSTDQECENGKLHDEASASTSNASNAYTNPYTSGFAHDSDSDSDIECDYRTPVKKRRTVSASDSGCATGPCSSSSSYNFKNRLELPECSTNIANGNNSSDEEYRQDKFRKRVKKARINIRKYIGDSDSN